MKSRRLSSILVRLCLVCFFSAGLEASAFSGPKASSVDEGPPPPPAPNEIIDNQPSVPVSPSKKTHRYRRRYRYPYNYRKLRRRRFISRRRSLRLWWSVEAGMAVFTYEYKPYGRDSSREITALGTSWSGRFGLAVKSFFISVDSAGAYFIPSADESLMDISGMMGEVGMTFGWLLGRYFVLDGGLSIQYYQFSTPTDSAIPALMFPLKIGVTFRLPLGRRSAFGLRLVSSFAYSIFTKRVYTYGAFNLVYQTQ